MKPGSKFIELPLDKREVIAEAFGVTTKTVYNALYYVGSRGNTSLAKRIRKSAMEHGGQAMMVISVPANFI